MLRSGMPLHHFFFRWQAPFFLTAILSAVIGGCQSNHQDLAGSCAGCHQVVLDEHHRMACVSCHGGNDEGGTQQTAHRSLIARPGHPDRLAAACGECHADQVGVFPMALHATLAKEVNLVRSAFGATQPLATLEDIPVAKEIDTPLKLADDLLRRRCLRCHLATPGDTYSATRRGTGCAACHLAYKNGKLVDHRFVGKPGDNQCLSCHYGNHVGFDYHGRFEHDFNVEYRTPYSASETVDRPYGVDYHELTPDVHQQRGLVCIDCHSGEQLMQTVSPQITLHCQDCHDSHLLENQRPSGVIQDGNRFLFISKGDARRHPLPVMVHAAHAMVPQVNCQVCHAQWSFDDGTTHLLRSDVDDYHPWSRLTIQGSSEIEMLLENNLDFEKEEIPPATTDAISGEKRPGIWYKGYSMRRWETIPLGRDPHGTIAVMRPSLDLTLSYVDDAEEVRFDNLRSMAPNDGLRPYTPHTTGKAGLFYKERLRSFLEQETGTDKSYGQQGIGESGTSVPGD